MRKGRRRYRDVVLEAMPGTHRQIVEKTGLAYVTVWRWLKDLHEAGNSHICAWKRVEGGGPPAAVYAAGPGQDATCRIQPFTEAQKAQRYRRKARASGAWEDRKARERAKYWADRAPRRDPLTAALFAVS